MDRVGIILLLLLTSLYMGKAVWDTARTGSAQVRGGVSYKRYKRKKDPVAYWFVFSCQVLITACLLALLFFQFLDAID